jgi:adenine deaminase
MLKLPVAGLMSDLGAKDVAGELGSLGKAARRLGSLLDEPFQMLSFLALPVIPELKLTDMGLVDVGKMRHVPLFI